jgi:CRP-like cAMP-binding protein
MASTRQGDRDRSMAVAQYRPMPLRHGEPPTAMQSLAVISSCRSGEMIYSQQDTAIHWYRVVSGLVKKYAMMADGQRQIVDFLLPGNFFGFTARDEHACTVEAVIDHTVLACYPRQRLEVLADTDPDVGQFIRKMAFEMISRLQARMVILGRKTAVEKVGAFLIEMAERSSTRNTHALVLAMSRYDIADYLGLSVETVSRALTALKHSGVIALASTRRVMIVNRGALAEPRNGTARSGMW